MLNSISVDTEEYYHATNIETITGRASWDSLPSRIESSVDRILELFNHCQVKGTFFILGLIAQRCPQIVKKLSQEGHEIASHGFSHKLVYEQSSKEFLEDISSAKKILEDITGHTILGYRASNFSITNRSPWAYDKLIEAGYVYDSSIYPIRHPRYTNIDKPRGPFIAEKEQGKLFVFPLATAAIHLFGREIRLPVAGGAYWRLFPLAYTNWALKRINRNDQIPFNCYFHPWEIDHGQPRFEQLSRITQLRHYGGIATFPKRLEIILSRFNFTTIKEVAKNYFGADFPA